MAEGETPELERRRLLTALSAVGTAALAGCSSEETEADEPNENETDEQDGTESEQDETGDGAEETTSLRLLHDTHFHGKLGDSEEALNVANYFGLIESLHDDADNAVAVGNGDDLHMSVESSVFDGEHIASVLNESPISYNTIGNHEFDAGPESLRENIAASEFTWVTANVLEAGTDDAFASEAGATRYAIEEIGGVQVGFTGFAPADTPDVTSVGDDVDVLEPTAAAEEVVADLRDEGADVIVVLSHIASPAARELAAAVDGIDVIVGDHAAYVADEAEEVDDTILSFVGDEFDYVGQLDLEVADGDVTDYAFERHDLAALVEDGEVEPHGEIESLLTDYESQLEAELDEVIGETAVDLDTRRETVRQGESNFGNWLTDLIREDVDADVAIQNGGGIRSDQLYEAGEITRGMIVDILPFPNYTTKLEVSGEELKAAIEHGVGAVEEGHGRFPQVSGLSFAYDPDAEPGERVQELTVGGEPVDLEATYELGTNDFVAGGGDGYEMFAEADVLVPSDEGTLLSALATQTIEDEGTIAPETAGRIETV
ncbi:bifunctional metallophosphatase/5'-nucleotidase [Halopiger aswanensis]|uniref:2',3'-cyclic-nucleotide 2'-phosphodiesterase/3'-nucleotidase n=1 Tax=Halopiger aswanensis TaxID=148449 RepID=A0A3R7HH66_9EURY|nr:5'-nucleotidase C-terminal domain-containing protein [Halopiger aswanensis]RKD93541.1 2',3'-cyclic-nucleotide 2'-phosphodiesterase/3'-nucleotidase [Halopiger aswanensis]